jgi:hypothetical protein
MTAWGWYFHEDMARSAVLGIDEAEIEAMLREIGGQRTRVG